MKKLIIKLKHWYCKGIYVRKLIPYDMDRIHLYPQMKAGNTFRAKKIIFTNYNDMNHHVIDYDLVPHDITEIRPATRKEVREFNKIKSNLHIV